MTFASKKTGNDDIIRGVRGEQMRDIDLKKTILPNGLTIIAVRKESELFSLAAGIKVGSIYESVENNGISHLVEHMLFKGTSSRNMETLNADIERLAGDLDIYTTYHHTMLETNVMKHRGEDCISIVSDMLMNASFPAKELSLEKKVIAEEIKMEKDDPEEMSYLGLYRAAFPKFWHKYHITGTIKSVRSIKRDQLMEYYKAQYVPENCALCIVSPYSHDEVISMVEKYFGNWQGSLNKTLAETRKGMISCRVNSRKKGITQAHVLYGFDIQSLTRKEEIALVLLNRKIGGSPNSLLFKKLRDNCGYAYNVYSDMDLVDGMKMYYIYTAVSPENVSDTLKIINDTVDMFSSGYEMPDDKWMELVKDIFVTDTYIAMESQSQMAGYLLDGELNFNDPLEYRNVLLAMETMTYKDLAQVGKKVLQNPIIHILSPR